MRNWALLGVSMLACAFWAGSGLAEPAIGFRDDFETTPLDPSKWVLVRMSDKRHWVDRQTVRAGQGSLAIRVRGGDLDPSCKCQLGEVREAVDNRLKFGTDAWYSFSFRIDGKGSLTGDQRWQIGGWKQESDGSPFVAQRFDNGVFHITLESGDSRVLLATSQGEASGFLEAVRSGIVTQFGFLTETAKYTGDNDVKVEYGDDPILPDPRRDWVDMVYRIKGGLAGDGIVEVYANGKLIVRAKGTIGVKGASGPYQYLKFGHNRAPLPGTATIYYDRFRRGAAKDEVQ